MRYHNITKDDMLNGEGLRVVLWVAALSAKNIDVFSVDRAILAGYRDDTNKLLDDRYAEQEYGVCTKKENTGLAELVDGVVTDLKDSGKLAEMIKDWGIE